MEWGHIDGDSLQDFSATWDACPAPCDTTGTEWGSDRKFWELGNGETRTEEETPQQDPTRLHETNFDNEASTYIEIESATGLRLLTEALVIAKEAWYDFCHQYQRDIWRDYFPSGPHEVLLETPMIEEYIGRWQHDHTPPGVTFLGATPALRCVKHVRNAVCHFRPVDWAVKDYDRLLQYSHAVAVALNDEPRAIKVRELRDELRDVAAETLSDIQNLGLTSVAPCRREWEPHHEWFLGGVVNRSMAGHDAEEYEHGPAVWLAVEAWKWQRQSFGLDHDE
ncbi:hypothetical protein PG985_011865 [Apiospora marii]|uniref:Swt1-like HEPN domain-containing protein n=1 Tax=Apiospora marii TaxID=335849 RepID=A0ABR1QZT4_9PEZI